MVPHHLTNFETQIIMKETLNIKAFIQEIIYLN